LLGSRHARYDLEVLAITKSLERVRVYLIGSELVGVTDSNAVAKLKKSTALQPPIAVGCEHKNFKFKHRPGNQMPHVHGVICHPVLPPGDKTISEADNFFKRVPIAIRQF